ncbi:MAG TPA: MFS transporter [Candidatus Acidoferrum sp.]|nr:MFS transporter [Candidatus Acidoferrum sp.]
MSQGVPSSAARIQYPPGFRARRGLNWVILGATYASFYVCRYNFRFATPGMASEFHFDYAMITEILAWSSLAYGVGQLVNGLVCDRIGGRASMVIGAVGTVAINLIYGFASFAGTFSVFALIWLLNGYVQSFGSPGMIKINAAWFNRSERGTFSGIFGFMIQLGQVAINNLAPLILAGFTIGAWTLPPNQWRWLFRIPPMITACMAVLVALIPRATPEAAGYAGCIKDDSDTSAGDDASVRVSIRECFVTIFTHPLVWFYALAYAATGAVRHSSDQLSVLFFEKHLHLQVSAQPRAVLWTLNIVPLIAVAGSIISGVVSDKLFAGHRSPVALRLYALLTLVLGAASVAMWLGLMEPTRAGVFLGCLFLILVSFSVNATHSIVGAAAPMDIGGRRMAGFASGVIDSFQYFGAAIALPVTGKLLDRYGWGAWYPTMVAFGLVGVVAMFLVMRKQKLLVPRKN